MRERAIVIPITEKGKFCIFSPIMNFNSTLNEIRLEKNIVISKANENERRLVEQDRAMDLFSHEWSCVIRSIIPITKTNFNGLKNLGYIESAHVNCCTALRLLKAGTVGLGAEYTVWLPEFKFISKAGHSREPLYLDTFDEYKIDVNDAKKLKKLYRQLTAIKTKELQSIQTATVRFNFSYNIALLYSVIDLMIGLEALYLADDKELGYKLAIRASFLLGDIPPKRGEVFSTLMAAYGLRSKLVHGKDTDNKVKLKTGERISQF